MSRRPQHVTLAVLCSVVTICLAADGRAANSPSVRLFPDLVCSGGRRIAATATRVGPSVIGESIGGRSTSANVRLAGGVTLQLNTGPHSPIITIVSASPRHGGKGYWNAALALTITAQDPENDPLEYQFVLDGTPLGNWSASNTATWTPTPAQAGRRSLEFRVRDAFGGSGTETHAIRILRPPATP